MRTVFLLEHSYNKGEYIISNIIGIYSKIENANESINECKNHPHMLEYSESYKIHHYTIDHPKILKLVT